jgi:hypothetical protein
VVRGQGLWVDLGLEFQRHRPIDLDRLDLEVALYLISFLLVCHGACSFLWMLQIDCYPVRFDLMTSLAEAADDDHEKPTHPPAKYRKNRVMDSTHSTVDDGD